MNMKADIGPKMDERKSCAFAFPFGEPRLAESVSSITHQHRIRRDFNIIYLVW